MLTMVGIGMGLALLLCSGVQEPWQFFVAYGLGRLLVDHGRRALADRGVKRISVIVDSDDPDALAVWHALGYVYEPNRARFRLDI